MQIKIKITEKSDCFKTPFGEVVSIDMISSDDIAQYGRMKRSGRSGYQFVAQLKDGCFGMIPISNQEKSVAKKLNRIKNTIKKPYFPQIGCDSVNWIDLPEP